MAHQQKQQDREDIQCLFYLFIFIFLILTITAG
jgi:hypothetical protein